MSSTSRQRFCDLHGKLRGGIRFPGFTSGRDDAYVFAWGDGRPYGMSMIWKRWRKLNIEAGVALVRFHDLRHTAASLLLTRGVHPKVVQEMLGHATIATTMDIYSHVAPSLHREAATLMDDLLSQN